MNSPNTGPRPLNRRAFLGGVAAVGAGLAVPSLQGPAAEATDTRRFRVSLSVSPAAEAVVASISLTDDRDTANTVRAVQQLSNGTARARSTSA